MAAFCTDNTNNIYFSEASNLEESGHCGTILICPSGSVARADDSTPPEMHETS